MDNGGHHAATEPEKWQNQKKKRWSCPSGFWCLRVFLRSTSWWGKKVGAVTLTRLLPHAGFTDGRCWVLSECVYGFWHLGLNQSKHCHSNLNFHEHLCTWPLERTACTAKRKKTFFFYSSHASFQVSIIILLSVMNQIFPVLRNAG